MVDGVVVKSIMEIIALEAENDSSFDSKIADVSIFTLHYLDKNLLEVSEIIDHYLHDYDIRKKDRKYAIWQTSEVIKALGD